MKVREIMKGIRKYKDALDELALHLRVGRLLLYADCVWSYLRYGCVLNHYIYGQFYKLPAFERKKAFTFREWNRIIVKANCRDSIHVLKNKVDFNNYYSDFIGRDWLYSKDMTVDSLRSFLKKHEYVIIKPMAGLEGDGIKLVKFGADVNVEALFDELKADDVLIEEKIIQHPDMVFGNKSVNTIRVYTIYNNETNDIALLKTVVRAGIGESIVDNSHSGGCAYEIDRILGYIISPSYCANGLITYIHPGTDICMLGRKIPYWKEMLEMCKKAARMLPACRLIGWDVTITERGPFLIEGNHTPDLDMIEFVGSHGYKYKIRENLHI